ncbi:MAG TPA: hypothetical protein VGE54_04485 [Brevundimonas sp.]
MQPVLFARFYKSDPANHLANIPLLAKDEDGAVEQAKTILAERFQMENLASRKPTMVDVCEALGNNEFRIVRRFYLVPGGGFQEQPLAPPENGTVYRVS